jgi:hypothetical protein
MDPQQQKNYDYLYSNRGVEYIAREKAHYQNVLKSVIMILWRMDLNQSQQKSLMQAVFRYFYLFNKEKPQEPFSVFLRSYEKLTDAVRFAMSD